MTNPSVAVVGTGALGSALLELLAANQFPSVLLIDPDDVEPANLPLSPFLTRAVNVNASQTGPVPHNKAEQLANAAAHLYHLPWRAFPGEVADLGWEHLRAADVICCCTDSALSRVETAFAARMLARPMLDGAVFGGGIAEGRVSMFSPAAGAACYLCGMGESSRAAVLGYAASASLGCQPPVESPLMTGTLATLERVAEKMLEELLRYSPLRSPAAASLALKVALLPPRVDAASPAWRDEPVRLVRSAACPWHDEQAVPLQPLPWDMPLCESLRLLAYTSRGQQSDQELQLAWPICTEALCAACHKRSQPFLRVAAVRRRAACPHCGLIELQPLRAAHRIRPNTPLGRLSPRQLGLPARHLYWLRDTACRSSPVQKGVS